ncbi:DUF4258 domain-containing protein [bacterium]|nr:DUF4258 domain-containing protein [bacterium]
MKKIYFSRHAKRQMKWREVSEEDVISTIFDPEDVQNAIKGRENAYKQINEKWIKVTFKKEDDKLIIITVIDKNK